MSFARATVGLFTAGFIAIAAACGSGGDDRSASAPDGGPSTSPDGTASSSSSGSSSSGSTPAGPPPATAEEFVTRSLAAICDARAKCCALANQPLEGCPADVGPTDFFPRLNDGIATGRLTYDPVAASACLAAIATELAACDYYAGWPKVWEACDGAITADLTATDCKYSYDCGSIPRAGFRHDAEREIACYQGKCAGNFREWSMPGAPCTETCRKFADIFWCSGGTSSFETPKACWNDEGYTCNGGTCSPLKALDAACTPMSLEMLDECALDLVCDEAAEKCVPRKDVGATCTRTRECVAAAFCAKDAKCAPRIPAGGDCTGVRIANEFASPCLDGTCETGKCVALKDPARVCAPNVGRALAAF